MMQSLILGGGRPARKLSALDGCLPIVEFNGEGVVMAVNANYARLLGYEASELVGRPHDLLVDPAGAWRKADRDIWAQLALGRGASGQCLRIGKAGRRVWVQAFWTPVVDAAGRVVRIIEIAADITQQRQEDLERAAKWAAVDRVQAVIEFTPEGIIVDANDNFLSALGYALDEVKDRHHRMFVDPDYARSQDYQAFWAKLNAGDFIAQEFRRIGKGGREVWIQASYNPVFDSQGRVAKIVKFATDVTGRVDAVEAIAHALERLAGNDLGYRMTGQIDPRFAKVREDYNRAAEALDSAIGAVANVARGVAAGANEISAASDDLSRRTEQQAASLEQTAAALEQITATVGRSADRARRAATVASGARVDAAKSSDVVGGAVSAMGEIEGSSAQISQIIGVIDEIAFQTNLLALNAGVEAARAGEAGRGFAVVAQEVRGLAQRSADAAKQIKTLIVDSSAQVERGVKLVGDAGRVLNEMVSRVGEIDALIAEIAESARGQSTSLCEVNVAVNQMDQVTQQNAAMVEEATAASASLRQEALELERLVARFSVTKDLLGGSPRACRPAGSVGPAREGAFAITAGFGNAA